MNPTRASTGQRAVHSADPDFEGVTCPDCNGADLEVVSLFGGAASEVLFRCNACTSCFNWIKWQGALPPSAHDG